MLQQRWAFSAQWLAAATMGPNIFFRILVSNRKRNNTRLHKQSEPKQAEWQQKLDFDCVCVCVSYAGFFLIFISLFFVFWASFIEVNFTRSKQSGWKSKLINPSSAVQDISSHQHHHRQHHRKTSAGSEIEGTGWIITN